MEKKILLEAPLSIRKLLPNQIKEIAANIDLPINSQRDLLFLSAILVSTGTNKNGATFLGSELVKARGSIVQKALDIEHDEQKIIGHITKAMYLDFTGNILNDEELYNNLINAEEKEQSTAIASLDNTDMDIGIVCIVYKDRFPTLADEIEQGEWKVSMECYYDDFDIKVGNLIVPRNNAEHFRTLESRVNDDLKLVLAGKTLGNGTVSRVLRGIRFCGVGIVKNPANDRSLILEAASANSKQTIVSEGLMEAASYNIESQEGIIMLEEKKENEVVQVKSMGFYLLKSEGDIITLLPDSYKKSYLEIAKEAIRLSSLDSNKYFIVTADSMLFPRKEVELNVTTEANTFKTNSDGTITEIHTYTGDDKELAERILYGPDSRGSDLCVSFEKYVHEFPGRPNPGRILATHWCKLFNKPCPVLGADAHDSECLRNKYSRLVNDNVVYDGATSPVAFNPRKDNEDTTLISNMDLPTPPTEQEAVADKPLYEDAPPAPASNLIEDTAPLAIPQTLVEQPGYEQPRVQDSENDPNVSKPVADQLLKPKDPIDMNNPYLDFPIHVAGLTRAERASLSPENFAFPAKKQLALNTVDRVKLAIALFPRLKSKATEEESKEAFYRIYDKALLFNIDLNNFEKSNDNLTVEVEEYAIPRLKLLPLMSKEQVISAMSRVSHIKVELSDREKDQVYINILRAAKKFSIDATKFRDKFINKK